MALKPTFSLPQAKGTELFRPVADLSAERSLNFSCDNKKQTLYRQASQAKSNLTTSYNLLDNQMTRSRPFADTSRVAAR
jgi:hypothetical protein